MSIRRLIVVTLASVACAVAVGAVAGGAQAAPRCTTGQLALAAHVEGIAGALVPTLDVWNVSHSACRLTKTVRLTITNRSGRRLAVNGNPASHRFGRRLASHHGAFAGFGWRNWCRSGSRNSYRFTIGARTLVLRASGRPSCTSPGNPSSLRFEGSGPLARPQLPYRRR